MLIKAVELWCELDWSFNQIYLAALTVIAESIKNGLLWISSHVCLFRAKSKRRFCFPPWFEPTCGSLNLWMMEPNTLTNMSFPLSERPEIPECLFVLKKKKISGILSRISQREKPGFAALMMLKVNGEQPADVSCLSKATSSLIFWETNQLLNSALAASVAPLLLLESLWVKTLTLRKLHIWVFKDGLLLNSDWAAAFSTLAPANRSSSSVATWKPSTFQHSLMGFRYRTWGRAAAAGGGG